MNSKKSKVTGCILGLGLLLAAGQPAQAAQAVWNNSFTPSGWTRGVTPGSHYAEWNIFNDDVAGGNIQDSTPEVSLFGGGAYTLEETTGAAFLTSGGNIYAPSVALAFNLTASSLGGNPTDTRDVYLRLASLGDFNTTLNRSFTNFKLNGVDGVYSELFRETITGGFGGSEVEALVSWLNVPNSSPLVLTWNAAGSSVSLDQLSIDIGPGVGAPVPLPAAAYLMASGLISLAAMARRKQRAI
ncbi:MAG: VPLPA-CTERM sorting domain-containing protein [Nitrospira sp.]|nr:VPLPA-CTERM sorting domain-containing protein [Nitrospira sp.]MCP9443372.1 VPLPA-CTERM sorting domain-containing protein [Nitrospira sp.]